MQSHVLFENHLWRKEQFHPLNNLFPAILRTSRFILGEALPILYDENLFSISLVNEANPNAAAIKKASLFIGISHRRPILKEEALRLAPFLDKHRNIRSLDLQLSPHLEYQDDIQDILTNIILRYGYAGKITVRCPKARKRQAKALENAVTGVTGAVNSPSSESKPTESGIPMQRSLVSLVENIKFTFEAFPELAHKFKGKTRDWDKKNASIQLYLAVQKRMSKAVDPERVNALFKTNFLRQEIRRGQY